MLLEPGGDGRQRGMAERGFEQPPYPWNVDQVTGLAVAPAEAGEDADHLGMALSRQDRQCRLERRPIEAGDAFPVAGQHRRLEGAGNVAPGVLEQRHQIVGGRARDRVLKIQQATGGDALASPQPHQVVHVEIPQHQGPRLSAGRRQNLAPGLDIGGTDGLRGCVAESGGHVPVGEQQRLLQQPRVVIGRQRRRHGPRRRQPVEVDEDVDGEGIERLLGGAVVQEPGEGVVAQVLEQQKTGLDILGEDVRGAEAEATQVAGDSQERADVLVGGRRVHQHRAPGAVFEPAVAAERGVIGQQPRIRPVPAVGFEKGLDPSRAISQVRSPPTGPPRNRDLRGRRGGYRAPIPGSG